MSNLVSNAIKYTPNGGQVGVNIYVPKEHRKEVTIEVKDNGPGIPPNFTKEIFEPFHRADHRNLPGFGLGLTLTKELVDLLDGKIKVRK